MFQTQMMGDILFHAKSSARKWGGIPDDYVPIHKFLDQSKLYIADWRHRALLHSTFGISLCEQFSATFTNGPPTAKRFQRARLLSGIFWKI